MPLETEIATFEARKGELEEHHNGKFVVIKDNELAGTFDTFENAGRFAITRFGRGPYLIRKVGEPPMTLPPALLYSPVYTVAGN